VAFVHLIDDLTLEAKRSRLTPLVESVLSRTRYRELVRESDEKDFRARMEIIDEFLASCKQFDTNKTGDLTEFLQELSLLSEVDEWNSDTPAVTLMTCHCAKGLEFDCVYLIGLEEGLLPHSLTTHSEREIEEERRLCYVAMTRARKKLTLSAAESRLVYGESDDRRVSRFVGEIPRDLLQVVSRTKAALPEPDRSRREPDPSQLKLGTKVRHATFGPGYVVYTSGAGKGLKARIRFLSGKVGTFMVSKTPLEILEGKKR